MAYIEPETVVSPRKRVRSVNVLYNGGKGSWSVALLNFDGEEQVVGIRWNGEEGEGIGNPQSRGKPTWFVVPRELSAGVQEEAERLANLREGGLLSGYREMANDAEEESEAQEWIEGLIGDANQER